MNQTELINLLRQARERGSIHVGFAVFIGILAFVFLEILAHYWSVHGALILVFPALVCGYHDGEELRRKEKLLDQAIYLAHFGTKMPTEEGNI